MLERIMDLQILLYLMTVLGTAGAIGMLAVHLTYRRILRRTNAVTSLKEKWLNLWKTRDKLLNRMNLLVWIPSLLSTVCLGLSLFFVTKLGSEQGLSLQYLYIGTAVPVAHLAAGAGFFIQGRTGDKFSRGLYPSGTFPKGKSSHSP